MRRRLFFWLDKLKITRTERQAIFILLIIFTMLLILTAIISPSSPFDNEYYSELDARFQIRTALMQRQEQQILARYRGESVTVARHDTLPADSATSNLIAEVPESALININTADTFSLQQLRGIGAAYAQRIIEYRQQNGPFQMLNELLNVKGIGDVRLQKITPFISLGGGSAGPAFSSKNDVLPKQKFEKNDKIEGKVEAEGMAKDRAESKIKYELKSGGRERIRGRDEIDSEIEDDYKVEAETKDEGTPFTINVNKADAESLQDLSGIGPTYARRIVEYRQLNGPFETKEQLLDIKGIGEKRLAKIKPFIKLTDQH